MIALSRLLDAAEQDETLVAFGREGPRTRADLRGDVAALAGRLPPPGAGALALHCEDAYAFAVGLLAAAQAGARVLLPPSRQPGALERLAGEVSGTLVDSDDPPEVLGDRPHWHPLAPGGAVDAAGAAFAPRALDRDAPLATLFTSGTTGAGGRVEKALRHLDDEVAVLESVFGEALGPGTRILASVAPQHLYGLLFRVLWPLAAGRPFLRSAALHPEELAPHADAPFALVSTPVALRRWVGRDAPGPAGACRAVFSSGGPLPADVARGVVAALGPTPWEIYGSTETGGVARRQQIEGDEAWRALPGVALSADAASGCLVVESPFVSAGKPAAGGRMRFTTADRVAFGRDGGFALRGRADRVIKVGEKRLSLADMEARLAEHPAVADAALIPLPGAAGETRVGAVLVPSGSAGDTLAAGGRRALTKLLAEFLSPDFERLFLPRAWRFVAELPRDAQGKLPLPRLLALFDIDTPPGVVERLGAERGDGALDVRLRIPFDLAFLDGHYPGFPIVAGVVQVHFAMDVLEELLGEPPRLAQLDALKFHEPLRPGQEVMLRVRVEPGAERFRFSLEDAANPERVFSSARGRRRTG